MSDEKVYPAGYFGRKKYFYICDDCSEAILQRLDVIKDMQNPRCRTCSNRRKGIENKDKIREATLKQMKSGNWRLNNLTDEEKERMIINSHNTLRKMYKSNLLQAWNKGTHIRLNTGRTHIKKGQHLSKETEFKKGNIPKSFIDGRSSIRQFVRNELYDVWIYPILEHYNFECQSCKYKGAGLHVHHDSEPLKSIINKFTPKDCRQLTYGEKKLLAKSIANYHTAQNVSGIVLCKQCHINEHRKL